jgi:hypothetical protein
MSQTISNDYVSMINKSGSGYNIPEIVDAIVDAAIVPSERSCHCPEREGRNFYFRYGHT